MKLETRKTEFGFVIDSPVIARIGIQLYRRDGKIIREYRSPEEVFNPKSLKTFEGAPVTILHPGLPVTSKNAKGQVVGAILGTPWRDGDFLRANVVIHDEEAIRLIETRQMTELSVGYHCNSGPAGVTPEGIQYDQSQLNITCNHLSIVPKGRAGVAKFTTTEFKRMNEDMKQDQQELIEDRQPEVKADEAAQELEVRTDVQELEATIETLRKDLEDAKQIQQSVIDQMRADIESKVRADITEEYDVKETAKRFNVQATTTIETMKAVVKKALPSMNLDGKDDTYIKIAYEAAKNVKVQTVRQEPTQAPKVQSAFQYL